MDYLKFAKTVRTLAEALELKKTVARIKTEKETKEIYYTALAAVKLAMIENQKKEIKTLEESEANGTLLHGDSVYLAQLRKSVAR